MPTASSVQELIDLLHVDVIGVIETTHDEIRESYEVPAIAQDFEDFKRIVLEYICHHNSVWYGAEMNLRFGRSWFFLVSIERNSGDTEEFDQIFTMLNYRF